MTEHSTIPAQTAPGTGALDDTRVEIDTVDDRIHELLMRRAELVDRVAAAKRMSDETSGRGAYRPAREAQILRRLHAKTLPPLPYALVHGVWRQMIGGFTAVQSPVKITVHASDQRDRNELVSLAEAHFGTMAAVSTRDSFARVETGTVAILPARFQNEREGAWWTACATRDADAPKVVAALPFTGAPVTAYCVTHAAPEPSGDDQTLVAVHLDKALSLSGLASVLKRLDYDAQHLASSGPSCLIRCAGFHPNTDADALQALADAFSVTTQRLAIVGAYPTPIDETAS